MIAGEQRDVRDAVLAQHPDGVARGLARAIRHADDPDRRLGADDRPSSGRRRPRVAASMRGVDVRGARAPLLEQPVVADHDAGAVHERFGAEAGQRLELLDGRQRRGPCSRARATMAAPIGCSERASSDAASCRMRSGTAPFSDVTLDDAEIPLRQRAGLVERDTAHARRAARGARRP